MIKPWSTVSDEELKLLRELRDLVLELQRGCHCEYDYRCTNCQRIIDSVHIASSAKAAQR